MLRRTRYQHGSVEREERKKGPAVWVYRWWEEDINGKLVHRKAQVGDVKKYPTESAAHSAADALRLTINNRCEHRNLRQTTINTLWEHYSQEELPLKALSTQDAYIIYVKNWIVPRWGNLPLEQVKTVEVERWLRATGVADGTKAKIKCVMSALFSHRAREPGEQRGPRHDKQLLDHAADARSAQGAPGSGHEQLFDHDRFRRHDARRALEESPRWRH